MKLTTKAGAAFSPGVGREAPYRAFRRLRIARQSRHRALQTTGWPDVLAFPKFLYLLSRRFPCSRANPIRTGPFDTPPGESREVKAERDRSHEYIRLRCCIRCSFRSSSLNN